MGSTGSGQAPGSMRSVGVEAEVGGDSKKDPAEGGTECED